MTKVFTADNQEVQEGSRVFDYYNGRWGRIANITPDGWFDHVWDSDPTRRTALNGDRVCIELPRTNPLYDQWLKDL